MSKTEGTFGLIQPPPTFLSTTLPSTEPTHYLVASTGADAFLDEDSFAINSEGIVTHVDDSGAETTVFIEGMDDSSTLIQPNTSVERMLVPSMFERSHSQVLLQSASEVTASNMEIVSANLLPGGRSRNERGNQAMNASPSNIEALTFTLPVESSQN